MYIYMNLFGLMISTDILLTCWCRPCVHGGGSVGRGGHTSRHKHLVRLRHLYDGVSRVCIMIGCC